MNSHDTHWHVHRFASRRFRSRLGDERGSISLFAVVAVVALLVAIGLAVDGGGKIRALQRADALAAQAARAGGQAIARPQAVRGEGILVDGPAARAAAEAYLHQADADGTVTLVNGVRLRVEVTTHYTPIFLGIAGLGGQMSTTGSAEVRLVAGIEGEAP